MSRQSLLACAAGMLAALVAAASAATPYDLDAQAARSHFPLSSRLKVKAALRRLARKNPQPACAQEQAPERAADGAAQELLLDIPPSAARISIEVTGGGLTCAQAHEAIARKSRAVTYALRKAGLQNPGITLGPTLVSWHTVEDNHWLGFWATRDILVTVDLATLPALTQKIGKAGAINDQRIVFRSAPDSRKVITAEATAHRQHRDTDKAHLSPAKSCPSIIFDVPDDCVP